MTPLPCVRTGFSQLLVEHVTRELPRTLSILQLAGNYNLIVILPYVSKNMRVLLSDKFYAVNDNI